MIELRDVRHAFWSAGQPLLALDDVSLRVEPGEFVALVGESGCGKSTILRLVAGLLAPSAGQVRVGDEPVGGPQAGVALVFQRSVRNGRLSTLLVAPTGNVPTRT